MHPDLHMPIHAVDMVVDALNRDPDRTVAIHHDGARMTAGELGDAISRYQQLFEALDPPPRRASVLAKNRLEVIEVTQAFNVMGTVTAPLHPLGSLEDHLHVLAQAGIDTLVFDAEHFEAHAARIKAAAPALHHVLAMGPSGVGADVVAASRAFAPRSLVAPRVEPEGLARIAFTGGTTGRPKGIMTTHRSLTTCALTQLMCWEWPREIRHLICAPLSHAGASVLTPILVRGGAVVVLPGFDPVAVMAAIEAHRITSVLMVPTMIIALIDHPRFGEFDLSSLETVFYGASAFPEARLRDAIARLGRIFFQFYGQGEAPMTITVLRRDEHDPAVQHRLASCGRPTPLVKVALLDDQGREVGDGEPGEICVRGPLVMGGYLDRPEETADAFAGDWLHTGDVAIRDGAGYLRIVDRKKDMIVTGGFNVFAREVEDVLVAQPGVREAAVFGVPDPRWGEAVTAYVVLEPGAGVTPEQLIARVKAQKGSVQAPKSVTFIDALPLSPVGKPDKKALRRLHEAAVPA